MQLSATAIAKDRKSPHFGKYIVIRIAALSIRALTGLKPLSEYFGVEINDQPNTPPATPVATTPSLK